MRLQDILVVNAYSFIQDVVQKKKQHFINIAANDDIAKYNLVMEEEAAGCILRSVHV